MTSLKDVRQWARPEQVRASKVPTWSARLSGLSPHPPAWWVLPVLLAGILLTGLLGLISRPAAAQGGDALFTFVVTADMRYFAGPSYDSSDYFRGVVEAIDGLGGGAFMVSPGDIDPPADVLWTITRTLGVTYTWYPVVGNHELPDMGHESYRGANMDWLNSFDYGAVNPGPTGCPTTTYSFDYGNAHFVVLNEYCDSSGDDVTDGDVPDHLYNWLANDLSGTAKTHTFVFGHEPAYPQPDADNGRLRHLGESLDRHPAHRDRFWSLLQSEGVLAYFCGHTHNYSAVNVDGVWQVDAGHARGAGDTGAPSTFVVVHVDGGTVTFDTYRDEHDGTYDYDDVTHGGTLAAAPSSAKITGTTAGLVQIGYTFAVTVSPITTRLPITYRWQAMDQVPVTHAGRMSLQDTQTFTWTAVGPKLVTVVAANAEDTVTGTHVITIYTPVQAAFTAAPISGVEPLMVVFTNTSSGDYTASLWDFGDGLTSTLPSPTHTYTASGSYTVTLTASGPGGTDTVTRSHFITVHGPVQAAFTASPTSGVGPLTVVFTNTSSGDYTASLWAFGDGVTSTLQSPTHTYTTVAVYTVTLTVSGPGGSDTETRARYITVRKAHGIYLPLVVRRAEVVRIGHLEGMEGRGGRGGMGWG
jgi:PKD repeat protein